MVTMIIDTIIVKINDLIDKNFISLQSKLILFSVNSSVCMFLQFFALNYVRSSFNTRGLNNVLKTNVLYVVSMTSVCVLAALIGLLIFQMFINNYYDTSISISIIVTSYVTSATLILWLSFLFFSWYRSTRNFIVFLYFVSMIMISFNLIMTSAFASAEVSERPNLAGEFIGSSGDNSSGRSPLLDGIYRVSIFISFFCIWITTAILLTYYREKRVNTILYLIILVVPFVYFILTYFYQYILSNILIFYLQIDPVFVSIVIGAFLYISKPVGGLIFAVAFCNIAKIIRYELSLKTYMIISGWGIFLIFSANQAVVQILSPYPPFGLVTITVLNLGAFFMMIGIYNSAKLVAVNSHLRNSIHKHVSESRLLGTLGKAEWENEIQNITSKINKDNHHLMAEAKQPLELDQKELQEYLIWVIKESKKENK